VTEIVSPFFLIFLGFLKNSKQTPGIHTRGDKLKRKSGVNVSLGREGAEKY